MKKKKLNKDVPDSAIIKQLLVENGKLKSEIAYLESELDNKKKAIAAFKEWQSKVAEYNYHYWLNKGVELLHERPSEDVLHQLRSVLTCHSNYCKLFKRVRAVLKTLDKAAETGLLEAELKRVKKCNVDSEERTGNEQM